MESTSMLWIEKYANRLNDSKGDLSTLSSDERKHLRLLLREYELEQQLVGIQDRLSQGVLPLDEAGDEGFIS